MCDKYFNYSANVEYACFAVNPQVLLIIFTIVYKTV